METLKATLPFETIASLAFCSQAYKSVEGSKKSIFCFAIKATTIEAQPRPLEKFKWQSWYVPMIAKKPVSAWAKLENAMLVMMLAFWPKPAKRANSFAFPQTSK